MKSRSSIVLLLDHVARVGLMVLALHLLVPSAWAQTCPTTPVPTITSPTPPADVCIPSGFGSLPIDYFDDYSWRAFVAMVWPAASGQRGTPDTSQTVGGPGPRVFETYKALWEVFHNDGTAPSSASFNDYDLGKFNACQTNVGFGDLVLASFSKFSDLGQAGFGSLVGPLAAQNGMYARYLTLYNQAEFSQIFQNQWYLRTKLPVAPVPPPPIPVLQFSNGSIDIKSAWIDLTGFSAAQRQRYYTRTALVLDPNTGGCSSLTVGLVGLHIVQKTPSRPQWIWSTFEQVDNVPPAQPGSTGKFAFNDGTGAGMPLTNPLVLSPLAPQPVSPVFNVTRATQAPIHPNTVTTNGKYQKLLAGTVWQNYQLVMTQWPIGNGSQPVPASQPGDFTHTFPGNNFSSAFANVTLETFDQTNFRSSCMNCHNSARMTGDFLWSMLDHAFPPASATPDLILQNPAFRSLQKLMIETAPAKPAKAASPK